ncbi:ankyrin repeat domain-containing protein 16-like [Tropilaelaps mercedesae]|uniref:Ankyrin repeat domain-containing protein 16-like n=1 Tax=Tropilaelaps mercedesae TaxID=418985 RepID=A0A1V9X4F8_9ACAR|nr:ankyrin repeat domain-containing protein 16-like [Tropilaelaps mercedesae]
MSKKETGEVREQRKLFFQAALSKSLDCLPQRLLIGDKQNGPTIVFEPERVLWDCRSLIQPGSSDTVLHVAARNGNLNFIRFVLEYFNLNHLLTAANQDGKCPLHEAAQNLQCEVAQYLIDHGTSVDALKRADWTPLMLACTRNDNEAMVGLLLRKGARATLRNKDGWTPFHIATR